MSMLRPTVADLRWMCASAGALEPWVGLQRLDHQQKVVTTQDPLELEASAISVVPDKESFDPADVLKADGDAFAALQRDIAARHEAGGREVDDMEHHVAQPSMFADDRQVYRMAV